MTVRGTYALDCSHLRLPAAGMIGGGVLLAHLPSGVGLPCPLRSLTGVPCPFCGLTTSIRALGGGHLAGALRAAPLGIAVMAAGLFALVGLLPHRIRIPLPGLLAAIAGEWIFELVRFHIL